MQNGARYQAVLELISEIFKDEKPADGIINDYMRTRKYIGSKDRRFICETVWNLIRNRMKLSFDAQSDDARRIFLWSVRDKLDEVFDSSQYGLTKLTDEEQKWLAQDNEQPYPDYVEAECPQWLFAKIGNIEFCKSLNNPADANFRVHGHSRDEVLRRMTNEGFDVAATVYSPYGVRSKERISLPNCMTYQDGWIDAQDESSQLAAILCDVRPEHKIIDYCCGAGGKSLAMSHILNNKGTILAYDAIVKRLENIKPRLERLGVKNIELTDIIADSDKDFDRFVIDAPCSGTGTWRRSPDAKFRLSEKTLLDLNAVQSGILETAAPKVKNGGRLIYMTCSVLRDENEHIIDRFMGGHPEFRFVNIRNIWDKYISAPYPHKSENMLRLSPQSVGTDGFFICILEKRD